MALRIRTPKGTVASLSVFTQFFQKNVTQPIRQAMNNFRTAAVRETPGIMTDVAKELKPVLDAAEAAIKGTGAAMVAGLDPTFGALAAAVFKAAQDNLHTGKPSTPDTAIAEASKAYAQAFGFGMSSAAVTALFEMLVPEKLNVLNGTGPMLAKMAGFDEVAEQVRDPLYKSAFGTSLEYHFNSVFKPEFPDESDAIKWHSRRLMSESDLREVFKYSALKAKYEEAYVASAYRPVQPRAIATMIQDTPFPVAAMRDLLEFGGFRDKDIALLLTTMEFNSTKNVRQQYLSALERSVELGTDTVANLDAAMTSMNFSDDAKHWVQLTVAERKLQQLAELYRKSVSEAYKFGQVTDANYVSSLEAGGISAADAQAHYAIDSIAKHGRIAAALLKAEERLANEQKAAAMRAAIAEFRAGTIDAAALQAALLVAEIDPVIASFAVTMQTAIAHGTLVLVYGLELPKGDAMLLREKVAALKEQAVKKLGTPTSWLAELAELGIPDSNAQALVAEWDARAFKAVIPA